MTHRIESVDILRGLTVAAMILVNDPGTSNHVFAPLLHAKWHGLTPTDLVFPFFLFIVGVSIYFAYKNKPNNVPTYKKIAIRSLKIIGLGLLLNWFLPHAPFLNEFATLRFPGVLQRIGVVFLISSILFLNFNYKVLLSIGVTVLIAYWLFLGFVPLPDGQLPTFDRAPNNWANYIDLNMLGNHMYKNDYDPEGILSTLPAIVTCISGILIAKFLDKRKDLKQIIGFGIALLALGYIWNIWFPINKAIWSSSFVLVTSGYAMLILAIIYYLIDIKKIKIGGIFKYAGLNALIIYFLSSFIAKSFYLTKVGESNLHSWIYTQFFTFDFLTDKVSSLLYAIAVVTFYLGLGYVLYKKKIFIKV